MSLPWRTVLILALACLAPQSRADQELERLRAENARLQAQVQSLEQACPVAARPAPPAASLAPPVGAATTAPPAPATAPPISVVQPVAAAVPAPQPPVPQSPPGAPTPAAVAAATPPPGFKLVPVNAPDYVDPLAPPYDHTGCSLGVLKGPPAAQWNAHDGAGWNDLERGQSMADVEGALGKEHYDVNAGGQVQWQYGRCGKAVDGFVLFENGAVVMWRKPEF